ncbi:MAG TPA: hypothetical protein PKN23_08505 [Candidatus Hydrogenedentes bacterium]|nr:hypothetical protein [Candidatus Hydrogenedentota bacterium]
MKKKRPVGRQKRRLQLNPVRHGLFRGVFRRGEKKLRGRFGVAKGKALECLGFQRFTLGQLYALCSIGRQHGVGELDFKDAAAALQCLPSD